jgi:hypothetical protein
MVIPVLQVLPSDQIQKGFGALVESLDDLLLDVPDGVELLSLFIARGVVSERCVQGGRGEYWCLLVLIVLSTSQPTDHSINQSRNYSSNQSIKQASN